jgi:hypothetical protein
VSLRIHGYDYLGALEQGNPGYDSVYSVDGFI